MPGSSSPAENPIESIILNSKMVNNGRKYFHFSPDIPKKKAKNAINCKKIHTLQCFEHLQVI